MRLGELLAVARADVDFAHQQSGKVLDEGWVRSSFVAAQKRADVPVYKMHDTRSTFATIVWSGGEAISTIQAILGHADVRTTKGYIVSYQEAGTRAHRSSSRSPRPRCRP